jgi:hypothetical protein
MLLKEIQPRIAASIGKGRIKLHGCEDRDELVADGVALAARMLHAAEAAGKTVTAGNIAFYTLQALKSGRRSGYAGHTDVLSPGAAMTGHCFVRSMEEAIGCHDDDPDGEITLHDLLVAPGDSPDVACARDLDWDEVVPHLDARRRHVLLGTAQGHGTDEMAKELGVTPPRVSQLRESIGRYIVDAWGTTGIVESTTPPVWRQGLRAAAERRVGRATRVA